MDFESVLICGAFAVVSALVIYLTSHFAIKERSFDEVMEEQRRKHNLETVVRSTKAERSKKDKKEKSKKLSKKVKDKETKDSKEANEVKESVPTTEKSASTRPEAVEQIFTTKESVSVKEPQTQKHEHVDFKEPEVIVFEENETNVRNHKLSSGSGDKTPKPILVNKTEHTLKPDVTDFSSSSDSDAKYRKKNSFDIVRPKDELELVKFTKRHAEKEALAKSVKAHVLSANPVNEKNGLETSKVVQGNANVNGVHSTDASGDNFDSLLEVEEEEVKEVKTTSTSHQKSKKHKAANNAASNLSGEVPSKRILKQINTCSFNNEEVQILINALLNKQSDGSSEWMKKNDPNDVLKKQLREKEQLLEAEKHNSQAAMARMKELRQELDQEKSKQNADKVAQERELQTLHNRYQQQQILFQEQHRGEVKGLQAKLSKLSDERNLAVQRLQEENSRLQQAMQQLEAERANYEALSHLKHDLEQMRGERQQYERRQLAMQQSNDELHRQVQQLEEHLKTLANAKTSDEFSFQQKLTEVKSQLQQAESSNSTLRDELQQARNECNNIDVESRSLKQKFDELVKDKQREVEQLKDKVNELNNDKNRLEECVTAKDKLLLELKNCSDFDKETEVKQVSSELNKCKEELTNAKNEIETQKKLNEDLTRKHSEAVNALAKAEQSINKRIADAVSSTEKSFSKEKEGREKDQQSLQELKQQRDSLKNEKKKLINCLSTLIPSTGDDNALLSLQKVADELLNYRNTNTHENDVLLQQLNTLQQQLNEKESTITELHTKVDHYKRTLSETNSMLLSLEEKVRNEESNWRRKLEQMNS